jgi:transposase
VCSFAAAMPMAKVAAMTREHDTRIWRIVEHHVNAARDQLDCTGVTRAGMDETSARKGQDYVSIFADLDARRVVFATEGRPPRPSPTSLLISPSTGATRRRSRTPAPT